MQKTRSAKRKIERQRGKVKKQSFDVSDELVEMLFPPELLKMPRRRRVKTSELAALEQLVEQTESPEAIEELWGEELLSLVSSAAGSLATDAESLVENGPAARELDEETSEDPAAVVDADAVDADAESAADLRSEDAVDELDSDLGAEPVADEAPADDSEGEVLVEEVTEDVTELTVEETVDVVDGPSCEAAEEPSTTEPEVSTSAELPMEPARVHEPCAGDLLPVEACWEDESSEGSYGFDPEAPRVFLPDVGPVALDDAHPPEPVPSTRVPSKEPVVDLIAELTDDDLAEQVDQMLEERASQAFSTIVDEVGAVPPQPRDQVLDWVGSEDGDTETTGESGQEDTLEATDGIEEPEVVEEEEVTAEVEEAEAVEDGAGDETLVADEALVAEDALEADLFAEPLTEPSVEFGEETDSEFSAESEDTAGDADEVEDLGSDEPEAVSESGVVNELADAEEAKGSAFADQADEVAAVFDFSAPVEMPEPVLEAEAMLSMSLSESPASEDVPFGDSDIVPTDEELADLLASPVVLSHGATNLLADAETSSVLRNIEQGVEQLTAVVEGLQKSSGESEAPDLQPVIDAIRKDIAVSQESGVAMSKSLEQVAGQVAEIHTGVQATNKVALSSVSAVQGVRKEVERDLLVRRVLSSAGVVQESSEDQGLGVTNLMIGMAVLLLTWAVTFYVKTGDLRLTIGALVMANLVGCATIIYTKSGKVL